MTNFELNASSCELIDALKTRDLDRLRIVRSEVLGAQVYNFNNGGTRAGLLLAKVCMGGLGDVDLLAYPDPNVFVGSAVQVQTDWPWAACMLSQYAGREVKASDGFAMGSGSFRVVNPSEPLIRDSGYSETPQYAVVVLETKKVTEAMIRRIAEITGLSPDRLVILFARTRVQPGGIQVVARSVETTLHKLHQLGFDLNSVREGYGYAPLPPPSDDDTLSIGRTNDAILYGTFVQLLVDASNEQIEAVIERVPSCSSPAHGKRFIEIFAATGFQFYNVDGNLFAPAVVTMTSSKTGRSFTAGRFMPKRLADSFSNVMVPKAPKA